MPSLGSGDATAVARTTVSPVDTRAAPLACLAIRPVSNTSRLPPASSTATSCFVDIMSSFRFFAWEIWDGNARIRAGAGLNGTGFGPHIDCTYIGWGYGPRGMVLTIPRHLLRRHLRAARCTMAPV